MKNILDELELRELLDNCSNKEKLYELLKDKTTIYCGFDPSNKSMQLGNFVMISILQRFLKYGYKVIALLGGATGMIGDPSGKKSERSFQTKEKIIENAKALKKQLEKYLCVGTNKALVLNNYDWWSKINVIEYLRDYGKYFQINQMLAKDVVKSRLDVGISYAEFSYMLLQSGDFDYLYKNHHCQIQCGGGDQWGNLTSSIDFVKKVNENPEVECFSIKLITDSEGRKFGKSENGALFLDPEMTSPYTLYQYFYNVSDESIKKYLLIFSDLSVEEIDEIYKKHLEHPEIREGQRYLAYYMTEKVHSKKEADSAVRISNSLFNDSFDSLSLKELEYLAKSFTQVYELDISNLTLLDALIETKLASSKREAREFVSNNSIKINGNKVNDLNYVLSENDLLNKTYIFLKRGKKNISLIKLKK